MSKTFDIDEFVAQFQTPSSKKHAQQQVEDLDKRILRETHAARKILIVCLGVFAALWAGFTAVIVVMLGIQCNGFNLSDAVAIAFLTTSLGIVLGLLGIGLRFFFPSIGRPRRK